MQEYGGITADLYAGQAVDGVGPMNCIFYCDSKTCTVHILCSCVEYDSQSSNQNFLGTKYLGLTVTGVANKFSYLEYWYGDNLTSAIPPASWFSLPSECDSPEVETAESFNVCVIIFFFKVEYYFEKHNTDGSLKPSSNSSTDFCSSGKTNNLPMLLYHSVCCGLQTLLNKN